MSAQWQRSDFRQPDKNPIIEQQALDKLNIQRAWAHEITIAKEAIAKKFSKNKKPSGSMKCTVCKKKMMKYEYIPETNEYTIKCPTKGCIDVDELDKGEIANE